MAIINFNSGKLRKSAGSYTFRKFRDDVVMQSKPTQVTNPRTKAQMLVRSRFRTCVSFYKHSQQIYWKYSFEDKKRNESDYNAFVRHNFIDAIPYPKDFYSDPRMPMLGHWSIAEGSLSKPECIVSTNTDGSFSIATTPIDISSIVDAQDNFTYGKLSELLLKMYPDLSDGCSLTFVLIVTSLTGITRDTATGQFTPQFSSDFRPTWYLAQMVLNTASTEPYTSKNNPDLDGVFFTYDSSAHTISIRMSSANHTGRQSADPVAVAGTLVTSVRRDGSIEVSNGILVANSYYKNIYNSLTANSAYLEQVFSSWNASDDAVLDGGLVNPSKAMPNMRPFV